LTTTWLKTLREGIFLKLLKQLLDNPCFAESLPEKDIVVASGILFITPGPTNYSR